MSDPRRVLPHQVHMVTRRCSERRFFLKPGKLTNQIVRYALARALQLTSVELYAFVAEANHVHAIVGDPKAELPEFMGHLDSLIARALNAHYGRGENLWSPDPFSNVEIHDEETLIRELLYVYSNPVKDGLVARPEQWPGVKTLPEDMGARTEVVKRPENAFFGTRTAADWIPRGTLTPAEIRQAEAEQHRQRLLARAEGKRVRKPRTSLPAEIPLEVKLPLLVDADEGDAFVARVRTALELHLEEIHALREAQGKLSFLGVARIRALDPFASAGDTFPSFALNPRVASGNRDGERQALLRGLKAWRAVYRAALETWRAGNREVVFPVGTYRMSELHDCRIGEVPILAG